MSNTVLAIIELDKFPEQVARRAAWIAKLYASDLELILSDPTLAVLRDSFLVSTDVKQIAERVHDAQDRIIAELAGSLADDDLKITTSVSHERPASDAIVSRALELQPRFVVKGTQYHSPAERATFSFTDWQLIRKLDRPLWLVKPNAWKDAPVIVAAVDPTHRDDETGALDQVIVDVAKSVSDRVGGRLLLLHTYHRLVEIGAHAMLTFKPVKLPIDELDQKIREDHRRKLDALAAANDIPADRVHQLPGRTDELLPAFARTKGADLVVMGALSRNRLKRRMLGSTAEQVLDHLPCDILIARGE